MSAGVDYRIKIRIGAEDKFSRPVDAMSRKAAAFARETERRFKAAGAQMKAFGARAAGGANRLVGMGVAAGVAVAAIGIKGAIEDGSRLEAVLVSAGQKFSDVAAKGTKEFEGMQSAVRALGRDTEFTANQGAAGVQFMAKAGADFATATGSLGTMANFASSQMDELGEAMELGRAMDISSDAMDIFREGLTLTGDKIEDYTLINDKMAKAAQLANESVEEIFEAAQMGASGFIAFGQNADMFLAATDTLSAAGTKGGKAGTDLQRIMVRLGASSGPAAEALAKIKFDPFHEVDGKKVFKTFDIMIDEFAARTADMTKDERTAFLAPIVGARGIDTMVKLLNKGGQALRDYEAEISHAEGTTERAAAANRDTTAGRIKRMNSAIQDYKLDVFDRIQPTLDRAMVTFMKFAGAHKNAFVDSFEKSFKFIVDNAGAIADFAKIVVKTTALIWLADKAVRAVKTAQVLWTAAVWLGQKAMLARNTQLLAGKKGVAGFATAALEGIGPMGKFGGVVSKLGAAGLVVGAAMAGWAFGKWIDEVTGASTAVSKWLEKLTGAGDELERIDRLTDRGGVNEKTATSTQGMLANAEENLAAAKKAAPSDDFLSKFFRSGLLFKSHDDEARAAVTRGESEVRRLREKVRAMEDPIYAQAFENVHGRRAGSGKGKDFTFDDARDAWLDGGPVDSGAGGGSGRGSADFIGGGVDTKDMITVLKQIRDRVGMDDAASPGNALSPQNKIYAGLAPAQTGGL